MSDWIDGESEIGYNQVPTFPVSGGVGAGGDTESLATIEDGLRVLDLVDDDLQGKPASPHACSYCGIDDKTCVVQCVGTQKWFCNSKRNGLPASCAVYHLVRSRSNEVRLHEDSPLGDMILECYLTGNRNVFNLGFAPCVNDDAVVLLARDAAMSASSSSNSNTSNQYYTQLKELNLDVTQWQPLVEDKKFLTWLVNDPDERDVKRALRLNASRVNKLEELWKTGQVEKTIDDVELVDAESEKAQPVALRYADAYQYQNVFGPLTQLEAEHDKVNTEAQSRDGITVRWDVGLNKKRVAYFALDTGDLETVKVSIGEELILRKDGYDVVSGKRNSWQARGTVIKFTESNEVGLELKGPSARTAPVEQLQNFSVDFVWKSTSFDRAQAAMKSFALDETSVSGYIYHLLLGHELETPPPPVPEQWLKNYDVSAPGLPTLNRVQQTAVRMALSQPLSLIQGPPGTGKTVTSATIVYHLTRQNQGQVIVCAPSNVAVDQLAERIEVTGLKVVRVSAKSRENLTERSPVEHLTLHYQAAHLRTAPGYAELAKLQRLKDDIGELDSKDERRYRALRRQVEHEILKAADVVCCTAAGAGDPRLAEFRFRQVLMDESTQATEPETLIPLIMGAKRVVMIGDHCQLGPVVTCKKARAAGLGQSLFERLILLGVAPYRLQIQYRMHPCLSEFPSNVFYEGALQNGVAASERLSHHIQFPWPNQSKPMMFWAHFGQEELSGSGTSYLNRSEASSVEVAVTHLLRSGVEPKDIGVVTPYEGQRSFVVNHMQRVGPLRQQLYMEVQVASVDSFQGREKDFIVLSCVRSNETSGIGFLSDPRRLNVAMTRARLGLVIIGNPKALSKQPLFHDLLMHFKSNEVLVEGQLTQLVECAVPLSKPKKLKKNEWRGYIAPLGQSSEFKPVEEVSDTEIQWPTGGGGYHVWNANMQVNAQNGYAGGHAGQYSIY